MKHRFLRKAELDWRRVTFDFDTDLEMFSKLKQEGWFFAPLGGSDQVFVLPLNYPDREIRDRFKIVGYFYDFDTKNFRFHYYDNLEKYNQYFEFPMVLSRAEFLSQSKADIIARKK